MAQKTITSANSVFALGAIGLFPVPVTMHGYETDKMWAMDTVDVAEARIGVDGHMVAGYTPTVRKQTLTLQPDSPSLEFFRVLIQAQDLKKDIYYLTGVLSIPSTGNNYVMSRGVLTRAKLMPDGQKTLQGLDFEITWESVLNASL